MSNLHPCANKCSEFKEEQCHHCLINETRIQGVYLIHRTEHRINTDDMGDDTHIENHISPLCLSDSRKNESQSPWSIKQDALSRMESCYIEQKKHAELLQTEVTRLNSAVERLKAENKMLHEAAATHLRNQNHFMDLYNRLVEQLYPYAIDLEDPVDGDVNITSKEYVDGYNRARECAHYNLLEMMESDEEYIKSQCGMLGGGAA